jgi:hypothetical protein
MFRILNWRKNLWFNYRFNWNSFYSNQRNINIGIPEPLIRWQTKKYEKNYLVRWNYTNYVHWIKSITHLNFKGQICEFIGLIEFFFIVIKEILYYWDSKPLIKWKTKKYKKNYLVRWNYTNYIHWIKSITYFSVIGQLKLF